MQSILACEYYGEGLINHSQSAYFLLLNWTSFFFSLSFFKAKDQSTVAQDECG